MLYRDFLKKKYSAKKQSRLPPEYQEIQYVKSTGNQYISEFFTVPQTANSIEIKAVTRTSSLAEQCIVGHTSYSIELGYSSTTNRQFFYILDSIAYVSTETNLNRKNTFIMHADKTKYSLITDLDGGSYSESTQHSISQLNGRPLHLLTYRTNSVRYPFVGDTFGIEITVDDVIVMNLIPCYRKTDNVVGFFDLISVKFITSTAQPFLKD